MLCRENLSRVDDSSEEALKALVSLSRLLDVPRLRNCQPQMEACRQLTLRALWYLQHHHPKIQELLVQQMVSPSRHAVIW
jgi:hypothetical protein